MYATSLMFHTANTERMRIDSAGNLGLGVTPSAWLSGYKVFEMPQLSLFSGGGGGGFLLGNAYLNSSAQFIYKVSGLAATSYNNQGGSHTWSIAPSGTAGNAISFTPAMTLDSAGNSISYISSRAPVFYDYNNSAYYADPASTSNFNALNVGSYPVFTSTQMEATRNIVSGTNLDTDLESGGTYCSYGTANTSWNAPNSYGGVIGTAFNSGIRGQMFYDIRHNTNNYSDLWFRSKNNLGWQPWARVWHNLNDGAGSGLDADLLDGMQAAQSGASVVLNTASNGYLYINNWIHPANGSGLFYDAGVHFYETGNYMYSSTGIRAANDMRAPIFYDSNDTNYYLNPNGISVLQDVTAWGEYSSNRNDVQSLLRSYNTSAGAPLQFYLDHTYGNVNIGNDRGAVYAGGSFWQFANSARAPIFYDSNDTGYYVDPNTTGTSVNVAGSIIAGGNVTAYSDRKVKDNIEPITNALDKVQQLNGVTFNRIDLSDKTKRYAGLIAQDIEKVLPEAVDDDVIKRVDYNATIGLLVEAIKELKTEVDNLKTQLAQKEQ